MLKQDIIKKRLKIISTFLGIFLMAIPLFAQKGTGSLAGVARSSSDVDIFNISGIIKEILIGPCELTTGRSNSGCHIIVNTSDDLELNIHLGPTVEVNSIIDDCTIGENVSCKVFRTPELAEKNYVAIELETESKFYRLRDSNLRPVWAGRGRYRYRW
jgi:hypothetical protein